MSAAAHFAFFQLVTDTIEIDNYEPWYSLLHPWCLGTEQTAFRVEQALTSAIENPNERLLVQVHIAISFEISLLRPYL
jgi:hypothetical protein